MTLLRVRWRKVLLDLWRHKVRTILVVMAITVGVFAVGFVASAQNILLRELDRGYVAAEAASATIHTQPFESGLVERVRQLPGVAAAAGRRTVTVRVVLPAGDTEALTLTAVSDFADLQLDKVFPVSGTWPPPPDSILLERFSVDFVETAVGESLLLELDDGSQKTLPVSGTVHDANVPSAEILGRAFGYVTVDTLASLGLGHQFTELRIRVSEPVDDLAHIQAVTAVVEDQVEKSGRSILSTDIPEPGEHWAQDIIETLVLLFTLFGFLILGLSSFLVVNTITALIAQQVTQIGVMKLVGGRRPQIMGMYFVMVLSYGVLALLLGVPTSVVAAQRVVVFATDLLNVRIVSKAVPLTVIGMQVAVGLLVPLLAALWPVINGVQITTHQALNSLGIHSGDGGQRLTDVVLRQLQRALPVQRPFLISLRNTVRKKGRLALTLATLIMGTALFIAVLSVRSSVQLTIDNFLRYHQYDVSVNLERPYRAAQVEYLAGQFPGVTDVESWYATSVRRVHADDSTGAWLSLTAVPIPTRFMDPQVDQGRWLQADDENAVVVNTDFLDEESGVQLGDEIILELAGRETAWRIVGVVLGSASGPSVYARYDPAVRAARAAGEATAVKLVGSEHDAGAQQETAAAATDFLENEGIHVDNTRTTEAIRAETEYRFTIIIGFLVLMSVLLAVVGGLGLTTTMSINILERIREIGVLRAIGASDTAVRRIVLAEGILIGLVSWGLGSLLAIPVSRLMSQQVGIALMGFPLDFTFAVDGMFLWLVIVLILATAASLGPARRASRLTIREVLAYE